MRHTQDRRFALMIGSLVFTILFVACGASSDSTGGAGSGGHAGTTGGGGTTGSAGTTGGAGTTGSAGTTGIAGATGAAGGTTGDAGTTGAAGATGNAGAMGSGTAGTGGGAGATGVAGAAGGRGGAAGGGGAGGVGGRGGSTGGAAGRGGASGAGGAAGRGGASGAAGAAGRAGTTGSAGTGGSSSVDGGNWDAPPLGSMVTMHVAGDSTAAIFPASDGRVGWASVIDPMFDNTVTVDDAALSGRSTKSYIDEGAWTTLQAKINSGNYLFIEFGHNDEKSDDPTRYTDPATTYRTNLKTFINGARAKGAFPVLMTSICRRQFSGTTVTGTHGAYTTAVFAVGAETNTPVVDMESRTKAWLMALGPTASVAMFAADDNTHTNMQGAVAIAKLAVAGIRDLGLPLAARALP